MISDLELNRKVANDEMTQGKIYLSSMPSRVEIESTEICNINPPCVMCTKSATQSNASLGKHLNDQLIRLISKDLSQVTRISLHGEGEPLLNPYLWEIVKYASSEADIGFNTNGLLLDSRQIDNIIANKVKWINFSLDASTPETYRKIRGQNFEKVLQNIRNLQKKKCELGITYPAVTINMTLMRENLKDVPGFVLLAKDLNARVALWHMNEGQNYQATMHDWVFDYESQQCYHDAELHDLMVEEAFRLAELNNIYLYFSGKRSLSNNQTRNESNISLQVDSRKFFCPRPWQTLYIKTDGAVFVCCNQTEPVGYIRAGDGSDIDDESGRFAQKFWEFILKSIGIEKTTSNPKLQPVGIKDIWNSEVLQNIRRLILNHEVPLTCQSPNKCIYRDRI